MNSSVTLAGAFGAGLLSFASPCVLPLVPPYVAFMAGVSLDELRTAEPTSVVRRQVLFSAFAFVFGFSTVFVLLGAGASAIGQALLGYKVALGTFAGAMIIMMGLHFLGVFRIPLLYREARIHVAERPAGPFGAYVIGLAFGFGWTPCIGPILGTIFSVAASRDTVGEGTLLLAVYSAGLGVPFVLAGLFVEPFAELMRRFRRHMGLVEKAMGLALVATGILFITGDFTDLAYWLRDLFPSLGEIG